MTMAGMVTDEGKRQISTRDFYTYLASPYNLLRGPMGFIADVCVEYWQGWRAERKKVEPRCTAGSSPTCARRPPSCCGTSPCG